MSGKSEMQECMQYQESACNISRHRPDIEIKTCDTGYDNGEDWDVGENKYRLTNRIGQVPQQRQNLPFVIWHRIQFVCN
jgi:hypothetical protein